MLRYFVTNYIGYIEDISFNLIVIQWNVQSDKLNLLLSFYKPTVIALQETKLSKHHNINYSNY